MKKHLINNNIGFMIKVFTLFIVIIICIINMIGRKNGVNAYAEDKTENILYIELDPGHGGVQSGAEAVDGLTLEKDINLKLAKALKKNLEKYENVKVFLTRDSDENISLETRTAIALEDNADIMISIHNNAAGSMVPYDNGSTILVANGNYQKDIAIEEQKLGVNLLYELSALGLENQGIMIRDSEAGETYDNGMIADYYALIRAGILQKIPTVIIEHAFIDDENDFEFYLSSDDKIEKLAEADAKGIARYYQLKKKGNGEISKALSDIDEKIVHVINENGEDNISSIKHFDTTVSSEAVNTDRLKVNNRSESMNTFDSVSTGIKSNEVESGTSDSKLTNEENSLKNSSGTEDKRENIESNFLMLIFLISFIVFTIIVIILFKNFRIRGKHNENSN